MTQDAAFDHDILILGGGLVGNALACALDGQGWRLGQVEASAAATGAPGFDERKLALARASLDALTSLDVLPRLSTPPAPIRHLHVSRAGDFGSVRLHASDFGQDAFGGVVIARELGQALEARLQACAGLQRHRPARVLEVRPDADGPRVRIAGSNGERWLRTRLLVAADGRDSPARAAHAIDVDRHDYGQVLVVCTVATDRAADDTAWERFTDHGPVALLPMAGGYFGSVCGVAGGDAARVLALPDAAYADYFQQRFGWRAGRVRRVGARSGYPLERSVAAQVVAPRLVLMGNAAQTLHPIGAQGFNLGLRDALTLAQLSTAGDPGALERLQAYSAARTGDRERTLAFSDGLARATANPSFGMHALRSLGLLALGNVPGLAAPLAAGAMGYRGEVPVLARPPAARAGR